MATRISAYTEGNRFFLCFENCDAETAKKVGDFVLNVLNVPLNNTEGFIVETQDVVENNPLDYPVIGTSGTLEIAVKRNDAQSIINTLIKDKDIPVETLNAMKQYLLTYVDDIEQKTPFKTDGEALIYIQILQPLCLKTIQTFLQTISPNQQFKNLIDYYASDIKNKENLLLKYLLNDLKKRLQ